MINISEKIKMNSLKCSDINIRDPYILFEDGVYYMYGTRGRDFGIKTGGFDVYVSEDFENWSEPVECFDSAKYNMNCGSNWAPEIHKYNGNYYIFATFTREYNKLRGTYILKSDSPLGPFVPHSKGIVTPEEWECLDGTLYVDKNDVPYIVFCHEHTQIIDGTICYMRLSDDLSESVGEPVCIFAASECPWVDAHGASGNHYITDGPFMYRTHTGELLMVWSSFIKEQYAELLVRFEGGEIGTDFTHHPPLLDNDGGHGMIFDDGKRLMLTYHSPNERGSERPYFVEISDNGDSISIK